MVSKNAHVRMQSGGTQISRRTVARGIAWSAPVAAIAYAAPAYATSPPPVVGGQCGVACKHPGNGGNFKSYHFSFCFAVNGAVDGGTLTLGMMNVGGVDRQAYSGLGFNTTVTVAPNATTCVYVDAQDFGNSASNTAVLNFTYAIGGTTFNGCATAVITGDVCGTGTPGTPLRLQPDEYPHAATGPGLGTCTPNSGTC